MTLNLGIDMLNAAVIGLGKQSIKHTQALRNVGGSVVLGIDPIPQARSLFERTFGVEAFETIDDGIELIRDANIAVVCTPVAGRYELVKKLAVAGIRRFVVEKPLCLTREECMEFCRLESEMGIEIYVNFTYRFSRPFYQLKKSESVDKLSIDYGMFCIGGKGSHRVWKHMKAQGGGAYNEMAIHMIDLANFLFGVASTVEVVKEELVREVRFIDGREERVDAEDLVVVTVRHEGGERQSLIIADFLSPRFANRVQLVSQQQQVECRIGDAATGLSSEVAPVEHDAFGADAYQRIYDLIVRGDTEMMHRPINTLSLLRNVE